MPRVENQNSLDKCPTAIPYLRKIRLWRYFYTLPFDPSKCIYLPTLKFANGTVIPDILEQPTVFPFHNLEELELFCCMFQNAQHFVDFICSLPRLNSLDITQVSWDGESVESLPIRSNRTTLPPLKGQLRFEESLYLQTNFPHDSWYQKPLVPVVSSLFPDGEVRFRSIVVALQCRRGGYIRDINLLLKCCGSNLKTLDLDRFGERHYHGAQPFFLPCFTRD